MKVCVIVIALFVTAGMLCSCTGLREVLDTTPQVSFRLTTEITEVDPDEFLVGVGDYLEISIRSTDPEDDLDEYTKVLPVQPDGRVSFLYNDITGSVYVEGMSTGEIAKLMYKELIQKKGIKPGATITVLLASIRSRSISIMGEVQTPGALMLLEAMTIVEALARSGGFSEYADKRGILLFRREGNKEICYKFNYKYWIKKQGDSKYVNMQLQPGDIIVVPEQ